MCSGKCVSMEKWNVNTFHSSSIPLILRYAHQHQRDPEGKEPEAVSPQPALPGPESDSSNQPQPLPVCASEPGAQTRSRWPESEHQHLLQPPPPTDRSVPWRGAYRPFPKNPPVDVTLQSSESSTADVLLSYLWANKVQRLNDHKAFNFEVNITELGVTQLCMHPCVCLSAFKLYSYSYHVFLVQLYFLLYVCFAGAGNRVAFFTVFITLVTFKACALCRLRQRCRGCKQSRVSGALSQEVR